jgi:hypothetical protein
MSSTQRVGPPLHCQLHGVELEDEVLTVPCRLVSSFDSFDRGSCRHQDLTRRHRLRGRRAHPHSQGHRILDGKVRSNSVLLVRADPLIFACADASTLLVGSAEDELINFDLAGQEEDAKNIDLKRKKREYDGYDDEEFDPGMLGVKKKVLSKYNIAIVGAQDGVCLPFLYFGRGAEADQLSCLRLHRAFVSEDLPLPPEEATLPSPRRIWSLTLTERFWKEVSAMRVSWLYSQASLSLSLPDRVLLSSFPEAHEVSDYLQEGDAGFRKPKVRPVTFHCASSEGFADRPLPWFWQYRRRRSARLKSWKPEKMIVLKTAPAL